ASPAAVPSTAAPVPTAAATAGAADGTCEGLVGDEILGDLKAQNWSYKEDVFAIAGETLQDGFTCTWADFTVASGNLLLFGWAPITADEADAALGRLEEQGWTREEGTDSYYVTEDATQSPTVDENGYGMTYEFGDGWVTVADTKQNLLLIERPTN
ncbi:nitrate ABC transporter substrate-binding protein, partial [Microbacterium sp.]|uniref:nitrate ABC transporter substrate-binding protein n=1 Tax=Microbacterium sp. TaxID=51671 RepID=UPI003C70F77B